MINRIKGTEDILPEDVSVRKYIENTISEVCKRFRYLQIRTPVFEATELFKRVIGDDADVVQKEMYTFEDKGGRSITLRPEGTAPVVRSYLENSLYANVQPTKLFYIGNYYRYEKPQAGRLREFSQFGVEVFGSENYSADLEVISVAVAVLDELKIDGVKLKINSIGCPKCRAEYNKALLAFLEDKKSELCDTCSDRIIRNPMRVLDCKSPICRDIVSCAPMSVDFLCKECNDHFVKVRTGLVRLGIEYETDPTIVRGLDYYTRTVFELSSNVLGAQSALCGGGRYDRLVEQLGGQPTAGVGFGMGIERLVMILKKQSRALFEVNKPDLFVAVIGEVAAAAAETLVYALRTIDKISVVTDLCTRSLKAQMKYANKIGAAYSVVLGEDEVESGIAVLKNMSNGDIADVYLDRIGKAILGEKHLCQMCERPFVEYM